ncbi:MAG: DUF3604 domain-containing protein [Planctomycetota bacterium]|nr:DUF3604 domain-containing protein [Planctomycetota bacterium]
MAFPVHSEVTRTVQPVDGFGTARLNPSDDIVAGSFGSWQLIYEAGDRGLAVGARLRIRTDADTDWSVPQFLDPTADDFMTVQSPEGVRCSLQVGGPKSLSLRIHGRAVASGEHITLTLGDQSGGGAGFLEARHNFLFEVDASGDGRSVILEQSPCVAILGGDAVRLVLVAPSEVSVGEEFRVLIKAEDRWGNPASNFSGLVRLSGDGITFPQADVSFKHRSDAPLLERGVQVVEGCSVNSAGDDSPAVVSIHAESGGLRGVSNPMVVTNTPNEFRLHWADPHGGQIGSATKIADFFRYARDVSGVQFVGYQRNADVISQSDWELQQQAERELHEPGRFIPLPGLEWSGRTPEGGHHNVYFRRHDQPVRRNPPAEAPARIDPESELVHIRDVYQAYRNTDTIITPHVGGEHSNLTWHEPTLEPAMEISSSHGSFEWAIREILERGYQMGFLGGSDCYTGRPGDDRPGFQQRRYAKSSLTGIYTRDISLDGFFEAMRARRVYATTGARIVLKVDSNGRWLGETFTTHDVPSLAVDVVGTEALESVEIFRGLDLVYSHHLPQETIPDTVRLIWSGASRMSSYSGIVWDGRVSFRGATVDRCETLRFDSPRSHAESVEGTNVEWHAWGCGYPMGLAIHLTDVANGELDIALDSQLITGPMYGGHGEKGPPRRIAFAPADRISLSASLSELEKVPIDLDLGILDRRFQVALGKQPGPTSTRFEFTDANAQPGVNRYWIRVVQSDLEMAWSSPLFIDYAGASH